MQEYNFDIPDRAFMNTDGNVLIVDRDVEAVNKADTGGIMS